MRSFFQWQTYVLQIIIPCNNSLHEEGHMTCPICLSPPSHLAKPSLDASYSTLPIAATHLHFICRSSVSHAYCIILVNQRIPSGLVVDSETTQECLLPSHLDDNPDGGRPQPSSSSDTPVPGSTLRMRLDQAWPPGSAARIEWKWKWWWAETSGMDGCTWRVVSQVRCGTRPDRIDDCLLLGFVLSECG